MLKTKIITDGEPVEAVLAGAEKLYKAVSVTMGPKGRNAIFRKHGKKVGITHDGVTVAKMVKLDDPSEDVGAELLREAASVLDQTTGDGTTTVTLLPYHILNEAVKEIKNGKSAMTLKHSLDSAQKMIIDQIKAATIDNPTEKLIQDVASVAAGSREIGREVGSIVYKAGADTPIMLGFSDSIETHSEIINGFKIDSGPASPYLMEGAGIKVDIETPKIIVIDAKLRDKDDILPLLRSINELPPEGKKVLIICSEIAGDALSLLVINHLKQFAQIAVAKVPQHIQSHSEYLSDIAISCGATVMSRNTGASIKEPRTEYFGSARRVTVEPRETVIIEGSANEADLVRRIAELQDFKENATTKAARRFAKDRLMSLEQKVISVFVGGASESDAEERHYRYEDAIGASRAALRGGVVPGGGTLLYAISEKIDHPILKVALKQPLTKVLENAGIAVPDNIDVGMGIDVTDPSNEVIDLVNAGIVDPSESEIECVRTAIAIAGLLMTTGTIIVEEGEKDAQTEQFFNLNQG